MENINKSFFQVILLSTLISSLSSSEITETQKQLLEQLAPDQRASVMAKMQAAKSIEEDLEEVFSDEPYMSEKPDWKQLGKFNREGTSICEDCIFGYDYFKYAPTTFVPINSTAVSSDYILGPGDNLEINLYGGQSMKYEAMVNREGNIFLDPLGPISLVGMTFSDATELIRQRVETELIGTKVSVSLKEVRAINVYFLGEAYQPGKYTLSGLTTVSNALISSGGVNQKGSLRNIQVKRNNQLIAVYDFYEFLLKGSLKNDVKLQDGDVVFIPFIKDKIKLGGAFKRPGTYEIIPTNDIKDAIFLGGGFTSDVPAEASLELSFFNKKTATREYQLINQDNFDRALEGDNALNVSSVSGTEVKTIKLTGEILNPGEYAIRPGDKVLDLLIRAGGVNTSGYTEGTVFLRKSVAKKQKEAFLRSAEDLENTIIDIITKGTIKNITEFTLTPISRLIEKLRKEDPVGRMVVDIDPLELKTDPVKNFLVRDGDHIHIPKRPSSISVVGEVLYKNTLIFDPNKNVEDYISLAGGLKDSADNDKIFVILPNGQSELVRKSLFKSGNVLLPGSTIVVSRNPRPFDVLSLTEIVTPIFANLATSAAAIAAISD